MALKMTTQKYAAALGIVLACTAYGVPAKTPAKKSPQAQVAVWDKEPTSFLGFELGKPVPSDIPTCPTSLHELAYTRTTCLKEGDPTRDVWWAPQIGIPHTDYISLQDGKVASVTLNTSAENYEALKRLLITRYGAPTKTSVTTVQNMEGGKFASEESDWNGVNVDIQLYQRFDKIDQSSVFVHDKALMKVVEDVRRAKENDAASKL
jgi:hypothetical protein